jgi:hypothetical protein
MLAMKHVIAGIWGRRLRAMSDWLAPSRAQRAVPQDEATNWAHASAAGEEDPGASVDLLDVRLPPRVKGDGERPR